MRSYVIDSFAGGGGASLGISMALGRDVDVAINHDARAIAVHIANHPRTHHLRESVWNVDPRSIVPPGVAVELCWFSPDCRHFSKAKGRKPVDAKVRGLAWFVPKLASVAKPRVILVENVEEFADWGPVLEDGRPCPIRKGTTFRRWRAQLERLGYVVDMRELRACDYGAPTSRKRLFVVARNDGQPIIWPEPTHGPGRSQPWRTAAECIDWSLPCPSIFDRTRPLKEATLRRIARGLKKFVLDAGEPFIVPVTHDGDARVHSINDPLATVTAAHRGELALVAPTLVQTGYGEREGQAPRSLDLFQPLGTVVGCGQKHGLVAAFLARHFGDRQGGFVGAASLGASMPTVTTRDHHSLITSHLVKLRGTCRDGQQLDLPMPTVTAGGLHLGEVRAFLTKFYGAGGAGQAANDPLHTATTKDRFGLVMVRGEAYEIVDIGFRMLQPRELARAQGFPDNYVLDPIFEGRHLTKSAQVRMIGNSVCPQVVEALVAANLGTVADRRRTNHAA